MSEYVLQYTDEFNTEREADEALVALFEQDGFLGGRTMKPSVGTLSGTNTRVGKSSKWRLQAFFQDEPEAATGQLPDGYRRVLRKFAMRLIEPESR